MEPSVESLFEQIKQSEIEAQSRKSLLNEVKQSIYTVQEKLKAVEKEYAELQQDLKEKLQDLGKHENQVKVDNIQLEVHRQEKAELDQELQKLLVCKEDLADKLRCQQIAQCSELENFSIPGWTDEGRELLDKKQQNRLKDVIEEEERLKIIVQQYEECANLLAHKEKLQQEFDDAQKEKNDMEANLQKEKDENVELTREQDLTQARQNEELNSIQDDILKEKKTAFDLREKCCDLQRVLQSLQQKSWQRNVQRRENLHTGLNNERARNEHHTQAETTKKEDDLDPEFSDDEDFSELCETVEESIVNAYQAGTTEVPTTHKKIFRSKKC